MRKTTILLFAVIICFFLSSCATSDVTYYSDFKPQSNKICVQIDPDANVYTWESFSFEISSEDESFSFGIPSYEKIQLDTPENVEAINQILTSKGYEIVPTMQESAMLVIFRSGSDNDSSVVYIAFHNATDGKLLYAVEAEYNGKFTVRGNLDAALRSALEGVPAF